MRASGGRDVQVPHTQRETPFRNGKSHLLTAAAVKPRRAYFYIPVRGKLAVTLMISSVWVTLSVILALPWIADLSHLVPLPLAIAAITLIAFFPGAMNAFVVTSLALDRRPVRRRPATYPAISVLVAAYNEESTIATTSTNVIDAAYRGD